MGVQMQIEPADTDKHPAELSYLSTPQNLLQVVTSLQKFTLGVAAMSIHKHIGTPNCAG
jgi:hypothetical protein